MTDNLDLSVLTQRLTVLEAECAALKDREAIRELFNHYGFSADCGDARAYCDVWTPDAVYEGQAHRIEGRDAFYTAIEDPNGTHKREVESKGSLHATGPLTIHVEGDRAWAEGATLVWVGQDGGGYRIFTLSYNHWDLIRSADGWQIAKRISRPVAPDNAATVWTGWQTLGGEA